jgi:hypothetical protein
MLFLHGETEYTKSRRPGMVTTTIFLLLLLLLLFYYTSF